MCPSAMPLSLSLSYTFLMANSTLHDSLNFTLRLAITKLSQLNFINSFLNYFIVTSVAEINTETTANNESVFLFIHSNFNIT